MKRGNVKNIMRVMNAADVNDINEGRLSYFRYNEVLTNLADYYGVPFDKTVAVFAALSPNSDYQGNLRSAASVLKGFIEGVDVELIRVTSYNHCRDRAFSYLGGVDFLATVTGKKIRSFYRNILNPMDPDPVTIDGHAVNIWRGRRAGNLRQVASGHFNYETVTVDYRTVAARVGLLPNQVQAITWFTWKRIHNIFYPGGQLEFFADRSADLWRTIQDPADIVPYEYMAAPSPSNLRKGKANNDRNQNQRNQNQEIKKGGRRNPSAGPLFDRRNARRSADK